MKCGVYAILNIETDWKYVGSAVRIEDRWYMHRCSLNKCAHGNRHLQSAWDKYGSDAFTFTILEECEPELLIEREQSYLPIERTVKALRENLYYNMLPTAGSPLGYKHTEESRQKYREAKLGHKVTEETRQKLREANTGYKHTEETRQKIREAKKGHKVSEETRQKIGQAGLGRKQSEKKILKMQLYQTLKKIEKLRQSIFELQYDGWLLFDTAHN